MEEELSHKKRWEISREAATGQYSVPGGVVPPRNPKRIIPFIGALLLAIIVLFLVSFGLGFAIAQFGIGPTLFD